MACESVKGVGPRVERRVGNGRAISGGVEFSVQGVERALGLLQHVYRMTPEGMRSLLGAHLLRPFLLK